MNRFTKAQIIMHRVRNIINGSPVSPEIRRKFKLGEHGIIPIHLMTKIALEELSQGKIEWKQPEYKDVKEKMSANEVVFTQ